MLSVSTLTEAVAELTERTGYAWTEAKLLDLAIASGIELHAAVPITASTTLYKLNGGEMLPQMRFPQGHRPLAVLFRADVADLLIRNSAITYHPIGHDEKEELGLYEWYDEKILVTKLDVRVLASVMLKIILVWQAAKAGIDDKYAFPRWLSAQMPGLSRKQTARPPLPPVDDTGPDWIAKKDLIEFLVLVFNVSGDRLMGFRSSWSGKLGDPSDWMKEARGGRGRRGGDSYKWNPITFANQLVERNAVTRTDVTRAFADTPNLSAWRQRWDITEAARKYFE